MTANQSYPGLTSEEVAERFAAGDSNALEVEKQRSLLALGLSVIKEPMILLLVAASSLTFLLGDALEGGMLLGGVAFVVAISLVQQRRTDRAVQLLNQLSGPKAIVIRDGARTDIPSDQVVLGDLVMLFEGNRVPADCEIVESQNLAIDESILTGESFSVDKSVGDLALSGTLIVRGSARGVVSAIGKASQIGYLGKILSKNIKRTSLQTEVDSAVRFIAVFALLAAVGVTLIYSLSRGDWIQGGLAGIAVAMGLLPEELPIVLTVFFALGAWRMAKSSVLVRKMPAVELLGQVSVLCVDKTGTITKNEMVLASDSQKVKRIGYMASPIDPFDPTDRAFHVDGHLADDWVFVEQINFDPNFLGVINHWQSSEGGALFAAKGAVESVLEICNLTEAEKNMILASAREYGHEGFRVLGVAKYEVASSDLLLSSQLRTFEFIGLAKLMDPVREGVKESVSLLREAGVRTVMITGDFPETAVSVAKQIGLDTNDIMSGSDLAQLSDSELKSRVRQTSVFCRIRPEQKLQLVELLQLQGEVVAMTGDGVNDAPALRAADVGIAMGKRGSEVAREASDLVIADDSFNSIAAGVTEGRRIFANLRKATIYVVAIHVPIFGMALLPLISLSWPLVLLPLQIALLEFIIDPSASLVYEREKAGRGQMKSPPRGKGVHLMSRPTLLFALVQGLALLAGVAAVYFWSIGMGLGDESVRSNAFLVLLLGNILTMLANRSQFSSIIEIMRRGDNRFAYGLTAVALLLIVTIFSVGPVSSALGLVAIDPSNLPIIVLASMAGLLAAEILKSFGRISKKVN